MVALDASSETRIRTKRKQISVGKNMLNRHRHFPTFCAQPKQVLRELEVAPRPHTLEFLRYDMNFNRLTLKWETLEEVRQQGKYVRDAREEVCGTSPQWYLFQEPLFTLGHLRLTWSF